MLETLRDTCTGQDSAGADLPADERTSCATTALGSSYDIVSLSGLASPKLSIVIPVHGNRDIVDQHLAALCQTCSDLTVELILAVDERAEDVLDDLIQLARQRTTPACLIRVVRGCSDDGERQGSRTGVQLGVDRARAPYVAVIGEETPYPYTQLIRLYDAAVAHNADVVMATSESSIVGKHGRRRFVGARPGGLLAWVARFTFPEHLLHVANPLEEFFLFRRDCVAGMTWHAHEGTLALDLLIRSPWATLIEVSSSERAHQPIASVRAPRRATESLEHIGRLFWAVPSAGLFWKITAAWLTAGFIALLPSAYLAANHAPRWLAWLLALEILLLGVALAEDSNAHHALRGGTIARRWIASHVKQFVPILVHAAITFFASSVLLSWPAGLAAAMVSSLVVHHLLQQGQAHREVLVSRTEGTRDETLVLGALKSASAPLVSLVTTSALVTGFVYIAYAQLGPVVALAALVLSAAIVMQYNLDRDKAITVVLALVTGIATIDYASWRIAMTNWPAWFIAVPLLAAETLGMVHTLGLQWTLWPRKGSRLRWTEDPTRHPIFIFIPTVAEGADILEPTVRAAQAARAAYLREYRHGRVEIVICNDGRVAGAANWREVEVLARRVGVQCVTRESGGGAKAGNVEHARQKVGATGDALIVIFDADQVAHPNFLIRTIQPLCDRGVGWVQTGQYYSNTENPVARWANDQQALFYRLLCPGKAALNAAFICGTNVMIRAAALDEIGGLPQDSVTEDFAASILLHPRWQSVYLPEVLATGLGPMDLGGYFRQQRRWALGTLSVLRSHWRTIFLPRKTGLRLGQRLQYALACTHYLSGVRDLVYVIAPLLYVAFGVSAVRGARLDTFLWHFLPYWCASMSAFIYAAWKKTGWRGVVIGFASFPVLVGATISAVIGRRMAFAVTSKRRANRASFAPAVPHLVAWIACVAAVIWNWRQHNLLEGTSFFVQMWLAYMSVMLSLSLWLAVNDILHRYRWWNELKASRSRATSIRPLPRPHIAARPAVVIFTCLIVLSGCVMRGTSQSPLHPASIVPASVILRQAPYLGVAGDTAVVAQDLPLLQAQDHLHFGISGRTQNAVEHFDSAWARELSTQDMYPWITLQFGHFQADGTPSLDASLAAIANGTHDGEISRWAREIRAFGKPVLLTITPNADRNWSLSSAVANGGIPADITRAWQHVHSIFEGAGADNVSWVWAPKDPAHDDAFSPPDALYDVVLVNVTYNPEGITDDPTVITEVAAHHPDKPVLVETTSVHTDAGEAAWLQRMAGVIKANHTVMGLLYFDGTPGEHHQARMPAAMHLDRSLIEWSQQTISTVVFTSPLGTTANAPSLAHDKGTNP